MRNISDTEIKELNELLPKDTFGNYIEYSERRKNSKPKSCHYHSIAEYLKNERNSPIITKINFLDETDSDYSFSQHLTRIRYLKSNEQITEIKRGNVCVHCGSQMIDYNIVLQLKLSNNHIDDSVMNECISRNIPLTRLINVGVCSKCGHIGDGVNALCDCEQCMKYRIEQIIRTMHVDSLFEMFFDIEAKESKGFRELINDAEFSRKLLLTCPKIHYSCLCDKHFKSLKRLYSLNIDNLVIEFPETRSNEYCSACNTFFLLSTKDIKRLKVDGYKTIPRNESELILGRLEIKCPCQLSFEHYFSVYKAYTKTIKNLMAWVNS
jgi:hypothetical protein